MLTLHKTDESIHIADLYESESDQSPQPIYWYPRKKKELRLGVDDVEPQGSQYCFAPSVSGGPGLREGYQPVSQAVVTLEP